MGQVLPGSNTINASVLVGQRFHGASGAIIAVVALMTMPLVVLVVPGMLYERFAGAPDMRAALTGASAAASGMVIGTGLKVAWRLRPTPEAVAIGSAAFVAACVFMLPLFVTVLVLIPLSIAASFRRRRA